jgi:hypothetical protein
LTAEIYERYPDGLLDAEASVELELPKGWDPED